MAEQETIAPQPHFQPRPGIQGLATAYLAAQLSVKAVVTESGCWEWTGADTSKGYGFIDLKNWEWPERVVLVHRLVYRLCVGPVPKGLCVLHRCDNPPCINPTHLFLGDNLDNIADKMAKGRHRSPVGEEHGNSRMTAEAVMRLRSRAAKGQSAASLAHEFHISETSVRDIIKGRTWRHLPPDPVLDLLLGRE